MQYQIKKTNSIYLTVVQLQGPTGSSDNDSSNGTPGSNVLNQPPPPKSEKAWLFRVWSKFDVRYMKPFLTNSRPTLLDTTPICCAPIARILTTTEQLTQVSMLYTSIILWRPEFLTNTIVEFDYFCI